MALNRRIGGAPNSRHTMGLAVDFVHRDWNNWETNNIEDIAIFLLKLNVPFHKFIWEQKKTTWIHLSGGDNLKKFLEYKNGIYREKEIKIF